jgi:hypothetical protein
MPARLSVRDTLLQALAQDLQDVAAARRPLIQQELVMVRPRHVAGHRHLAPTDPPDIEDRVMRGATEARRDARRAVAGVAGDARETRAVEGFGESHGRQGGGGPARQPRFSPPWGRVSWAAPLSRLSP